MSPQAGHLGTESQLWWNRSWNSSPVAEIRGEIRELNTRVLNAMREDLIDLRQRVETGFTRVDNGFTEMRGKLDGAAAGQQQIITLLTTLIGQQGGQRSRRAPTKPHERTLVRAVTSPGSSCPAPAGGRRSLARPSSRAGAPPLS
jgi:hypothetical protein